MPVFLSVQGTHSMPKHCGFTNMLSLVVVVVDTVLPQQTTASNMQPHKPYSREVIEVDHHQNPKTCGNTGLGVGYDPACLPTAFDSMFESEAVHNTCSLSQLPGVESSCTSHAANGTNPDDVPPVDHNQGPPPSHPVPEHRKKCVKRTHVPRHDG